MTAFTAIKTAIDIAKSINDADKSLEKAELKLKIAELMEALARAKGEMVQMADLIREKDQEIWSIANSIIDSISIFK